MCPEAARMFVSMQTLTLGPAPLLILLISQTDPPHQIITPLCVKAVVMAFHLKNLAGAGFVSDFVVSLRLHKQKPIPGSAVLRCCPAFFLKTLADNGHKGLRCFFDFRSIYIVFIQKPLTGKKVL